MQFDGNTDTSKGLNNVPWIESSDLINTVIIGSGVTSIEVDAFYRCMNLTSVTIPDSLLSIGDGAFYGCAKT